MKTINDIKNEEVRKEIVKLQGIFEDSFLNDELEFIAIHNIHLQAIYGERIIIEDKCFKVPKKAYFVNLYFLTTNITTKNEVKAKVLEYFSRACYKTMYASEQVDFLIHIYILDCVNEYLHTDFNEDDIELIYTYLGNGINRELTLKFIESGYDLNIIRDYKEKR